MKHQAIEDDIKAKYEPISYDEYLVAKVSKKLDKELTIGEFKKSKINSYFACGIQPWISAKFFEHKEEYEKTPYLKTGKN